MIGGIVMAWSLRRRSPVAGAVLSLALLIALVVAPGGAAAHPGERHYGDEHPTDGIGVQVNSPDGLVGFHSAVQWGDTGDIDDQTAELVYAGSGCSPASYAPVIDQIQGNIALVDSRQSATNPADECPASTFFQKVQSAQQAGAIGFVQIPAEGEDPRANATAVDADIPALEVYRTDAIVEVRDAVIEGTSVNATLTDTHEPIELDERLSDLRCEDGQAGPFECDGIDLLAFVPAEEFNGAGQSDLWGWTDEETGDEYVIIGKTNGVAFFRVTDPTDPVYLGELPNHAALHRIWHDIKVYADHAFIVSESEPHGMRVFDLTRLRDVTEPQEWDQDGFYPLHSAAHNVEVNTETGFAYIVGGNAGIVVPDHCLSGLHMVDISNPTSPTFAGCYFEEGGPGTAARSVGSPVEENSPAAYVHDTQCVVYDGPDERYTGQEICFNSAEDKVVIVDVTDKLNPVTLGWTDYPNVGYTHQGWLTEDHSYLIVNDELDELEYDEITNTRTVVLDVTDLEDPTFHFEHFHDTRAITHNNYVKDGLVYQSNYTSGVRVLDTASIGDGDAPRLEEVGYFDTFPSHGEPIFAGTWSNFPYFGSGTIAASGIDEGLFLLRLAGDHGDAEPQFGVDLACVECEVEVRAGESGTAQLTVTNTGDVDDTYDVTFEGLPDGWSASAEPAAVPVAAGDRGEFAVTVEVPRQERAGGDTFTVIATSAGDPSVSGSADVTVDVTKGRPSRTGPSEGGQGGPAGDDATEEAGEASVLGVTGSGSPTTPLHVLLVLVLAGVVATVLGGGLRGRG
jgi:choice-of-anchor B domain-containing protein